MAGFPPRFNVAMTNDIATLIWLLSAFLLAGLVKGVTGMGLPTVAMALLGALYSPVVAAALLIVPSLITNVWQFLKGGYRWHVLSRFSSMMLGIPVGAFLGAPLLSQLDADWAAFSLGCALMLYSIYSFWAPAINILPKYEPWLSPIIGLLTGWITGATGVFVLPAVPYLQALGIARNELIQALGLSFTVSTLALLSSLAVQHSLETVHLALSLYAVLPALAGMWLGGLIRSRISTVQFRCWFLLTLSLLAVDLMSRPFR
ncbi:sulfite exporter TauE/SafE family protein [Vreelandella venusta]|uniref:sulfite exporter TauE/SafE family protein n=1 Tax=Vreelandella venusta TaxID=44935 RepID=UPI002285CD79|nr:sulfite exporter TauE/SafE family protein [Halomonas venusta]WAM56866.1 sulfite exporter TauE/SafE family protein [Halomonas venusta]